MQIRRGDIIRHALSKDLAFYISDIFTFKTGVYIHGTWVNQGFNDTYFLDLTESHFIGFENLSNWFKCEEPDAQCIRYKQWTQLGETK